MFGCNKVTTTATIAAAAAAATTTTTTKKKKKKEKKRRRRIRRRRRNSEKSLCNVPEGAAAIRSLPNSYCTRGFADSIRLKRFKPTRRDS